MTEINKLRTEHALYEKALKQIRCDYVASTIAHQTADAALNPPPPTPITVQQIQTALTRKAGDYGNPSLEIFADGSVLVGEAIGTLAFTTVQAGLNYLNDTGAA